MAAGSAVALSRDIQTLFDDGSAVGLTDRQLLDRFGLRGDPMSEAAFEVLVHRHGPMVLRVCRNALPDAADAADAFQATFLVLVRRRGSLRGLDSLGGWLYGVACRVAARARVESARRRSREARAAARVAEAVDPAGIEDVEREDLGPVVQEEVRRLPEKYRSAVVLCYWEGLTQEQAAAQLGVPLGTVRSRMARARDLLQRRLGRRGIGPLAVAAGPIRGLSPPALELVRATVRAAVEIGGSPIATPIVSAAAVPLVRWMLWRMAMVRLGGIAAGVILVGLTGYGAGLAAQRAGDTKAPSRPVAEHAAGRPAPGANPAGARRKDSAPHPVRTKVEGDTRIIAVVPDGTRVKKGDVICELDSAALKDQLVDQRIRMLTAESAYKNARLAREVAEIAVKEYVEGNYVNQLQDVDGRVKIAQAELALAEEELKAAGQSDVPLKLKRAEVSVLRARLGLEKAQSGRDLLVKYTRDRRIKELENEVKKVHSHELARQAIYELERQKEHNLETQIVNCTIRAPIDGQVELYAVQTSNGVRTTVREDITVRERQTLLVIKPVDSSVPPKE